MSTSLHKSFTVLLLIAVSMVFVINTSTVSAHDKVILIEKDLTSTTKTITIDDRVIYKMTWYKDGRPPVGTEVSNHPHVTKHGVTKHGVTSHGVTNHGQPNPSRTRLETNAQARHRILALRGTPYKRGRSSANGASCAGFVALILRRFGVRAPESNVKQLWKFGRKISRGQIRLGDVLFFSNNPSRKRADFAGVALSPKEMFYMSAKGGRARLQRIDSDWWRRIFFDARRVIERRSSGHFVIKPKPSDASVPGNSRVQRGIASFYGREANSDYTASGERFYPTGMTAAHRTLPMDSQVKVTNLRNRRSVVLRINDRGPYIDGRIIDLTKAAARKLDMVGSGIAEVEVRVLRYGDGGR